MPRGDGASDLQSLKDALADDDERLLLHLFGEPTQRSKRGWRWGRKGGRAYRPDRKVFYSFEAERGGTLLDAIMDALGISLPDAITWARDWIGEDGTEPKAERRQPPPRPSAFDADREEDERAAIAADMWCVGRSIEGTAAERYLSGRGIDARDCGAVRFIGARDVARISGWAWWRWPAVMFAATNAAGAVRAVQLVALNDDGSPVPHWEDRRRKLKVTRGSMRDTAVRFAGNAGGPLLLCEGPETALSVWMAFRDRDMEVWSNLGSIAKAPLEGVPVGRLVVVCRDDDPRNAPSRQALRKKIQEWRQQGRNVLETTPWSRSRGDKSDFNDVLKAGGADAIQARFDEALIPQATPKGPATAAARRDLDEAIQSAFLEMRKPRVAGDAASFLVIRAALGLGKTEAALHACGDAIRTGESVAYFAPNHKLAEELRARAERSFAAMGVDARVRVWRGRDQPDPTDTSKKMCVNGAAAEAARLARLDVGGTVCKVCPHKADCAYLLQAEDIADLWLMPTSMLWLERRANMRDVSLAVIDESFGLGGLVGIDGPPLIVTGKDLDTRPDHGSGGPAATADLRADLMPRRDKLRAALETHPSGPLRRAPLLAAGLTASEAEKAADLETKRLVRVETKPDMSHRELLREIRRADGNGQAANDARMWREVARLLDDQSGRPSGRIRVVAKDGSFDHVRLCGAQERGKGWEKVPTLHMDATADLTLIGARVSNARPWRDIGASMPFAKVQRYVGRTFGKGDLTGNPHSLRDAWLWCVHRAAHRGGRWLVITHKPAVEAIRERFQVPDFIDLAHFGAVAGRDEWRDVRGVIVVGRQEPGPMKIESIAGALTGRALEPMEGWYPAATVTLSAADGSSCTVEADRHPDALSEAIRWSTCEAELMQAIGRGRGVNRNELKPLDIVILGNVPLPFELDTLEHWRPLAFDDALMAEHGAVPTSYDVCAKMTGASSDAVKKARQRSGSAGQVQGCKTVHRGTFPYNYYLYGNVPLWGFVGYQAAGSRGRPASGMTYDARRIPDPADWLTQMAGPVEIKYHHDPLAAGGAARCKITGQLNFMFAGLDQGENMPDEERRAIERAAVGDDAPERKAGRSYPRVAEWLESGAMQGAGPISYGRPGS